MNKAQGVCRTQLRRNNLFLMILLILIDANFITSILHVQRQIEINRG